MFNLQLDEKDAVLIDYAIKERYLDLLLCADIKSTNFVQGAPQYREDEHDFYIFETTPNTFNGYYTFEGKLLTFKWANNYYIEDTFNEIKENHMTDSNSSQVERQSIEE